MTTESARRWSDEAETCSKSLYFTKEKHSCADWRSCRVYYIHFLRTKLHGVRSEQPWEGHKFNFICTFVSIQTQTGTVSVLFIAVKTGRDRALQKWRNKEGGDLQSSLSCVGSVSQGRSKLSAYQCFLCWGGEKSKFGILYSLIRRIMKWLKKKLSHCSGHADQCVYCLLKTEYSSWLPVQLSAFH